VVVSELFDTINFLRDVAYLWSRRNILLESGAILLCTRSFFQLYLMVTHSKLSMVFLYVS
jgi:hypothetical protein